MKGNEDLSGIAQMLQAELRRRFVKYTAPGTDGHNPVMLAATALDARYKVLLNPVPCAKKMLMDMVSSMYICSVSAFLRGVLCDLSLCLFGVFCDLTRVTLSI